MTKDLKTRLITPDLLKGIAILFMIQVHLMELFARPAVFTSWAGKLSLFLGGTPAAPVFMIIMGYFVAQSSLSRTKTLRRGFQLIFWGMLLNIGINLNLIYHVLFEGWNYDLLPYIFGVDIFQLAGLSLIIIAILPRIIKTKWYLMAFFIFIIFIINHFINGQNIPNGWNYFTAYFIGGTNWSYFPLLPWLVYLLSGYAFLQLETFFLTWSWHKYFKIFVIVSFTVFIGLSWNYAASISYDLKAYYQHGFGFYLWSILFALLWAGLFNIFTLPISKTKFGQYLIFIGKNITSIYIFQWLIIGNLATIWFQQKTAIELVFFFILITILSSSLSWVWNRLKSNI